MSWATWALPTPLWARPRKAIEYHEQALKISREIGDQRGEGNAWATWAWPTPLGEPRKAIESTSRRWTLPARSGTGRGKESPGQPGLAYAYPGRAAQGHRVLRAGVEDRSARSGTDGAKEPAWATWAWPTPTWASPQGHRVLRAGADHSPRDRGPAGGRRPPGQPGPGLRRPGRDPQGHRVLRAALAISPRDRGPKR